MARLSKKERDQIQRTLHCYPGYRWAFWLFDYEATLDFVEAERDTALALLREVRKQIAYDDLAKRIDAALGAKL